MFLAEGRRVGLYEQPDRQLSLEQLNGGTEWLKFSALEQTMPKELPLASESRVSTTYYPGNENASVQILGSRRDPISLKGRLDDRYILGQKTALSMMESMRKLASDGFPVMLQWGPITLDGLVTKAKFVVHLAELIEYEVEFLPTGKQPAMVVKPPKTVAFSRTNILVVTEQSNKIVDLWGIVGDEYDPYAPLGRPKFTIPGLAFARGLLSSVSGLVDIAGSYVDAGRAAIASVENLVSDTLDVADEAVHVVARATGVVGELRSWAADVSNTLQSIDADASAIVHDVRATFAAEGWRNEIGTAARDTVAMSTNLIAQLSPVEWTNPIHISRDGETLPNIARIYYGTPIGWQRIADANDLGDDILLPGTILIIPQR
jgi:hypothetical protein